jgi:hypothetical protein
MSEIDHHSSAPAGDRDAGSSRQESFQRRRRQSEEEAKPDMPMYMQILINTIPMLLISLLMTAGLMYYKRFRVPYQVPQPVGISTGVTIDSDIMAVYEFLSTPELRTEWHMNAVEVSGPAMDHSAIVGKLLPFVLFLKLRSFTSHVPCVSIIPSFRFVLSAPTFYPRKFLHHRCRKPMQEFKNRPIL